MEKKILVVFYSRTGTTKKIAEEISHLLQCDIEEIIDNKDRSGIKGFMTGGRDAMARNLTEIKEIIKNPGDYDIVVIGTPVWAANMTPAIRTYISNNKEKFKQVAFFCTTGGTGIDKTFLEMEVLCGKQPIATFSATARQVKTNKYDLREFIEKLK
jgi:flavodoxin